MGRNGREWGGRYSGIRVGSGEFLEETGRIRCRGGGGGGGGVTGSAVQAGW